MASFFNKQKSIDGKPQPNDVELEKVVLGAIMLESSSLADVGSLLKESTFYMPQHQLIYLAINKLQNNGTPIDIMTVTHQLRLDGKLNEVGGSHYVASLTQRVGSSANITYHTRILIQHEMARLLIQMSDDVMRKAYADNMDIFDLYEEAKNRFDTIEASVSERTGGLIPVLNILNDLNQHYEEAVRLSKEKGITGVETGFWIVNEKTAGWQKSDLIILAGRPGCGKSSFALGTALGAAMAKVPTAFFSLEMSKIQLLNRGISGIAKIEHDKIKRGKMSQTEYDSFLAAENMIANIPLYIDDFGAQTISTMRSRCKTLKASVGLGLIVVDYLQIVQVPDSKGYSREQDVSSIARGLKIIAKELDVPVIALSQLSRDVEKRNDKRPMLSDLRDSGAIEQEADMVIMGYRPEYYGVYSNINGDIVPDGSPEICYGYTEFNIEKHRSGSLGVMPLRFKEQFSTFYNIDEALPFTPPPAMQPNIHFNEPKTDDLPF